ncbi:UNVERIFIED_CONTAM: hypothetical protein RMT77_011113 [Armadillidium vulgare]
MDSGISNVFINAVAAIMKGLSFKLVCLILFVFFLNSAKCQPTINWLPIDIRCTNTTDRCIPLLCFSSSSSPFCCFDGCRNICSD